MTERAPRRKFLRYIASAVVGGIVAAGSVYSLDSGTREKVVTLNQQLGTIQQANVSLQKQVTSLQQEASSNSSAISSNVVGYVFASKGGSFSTIDLVTQRLVTTSTILDLQDRRLFFANSRLDNSGKIWAGEHSTGKVFAIDPFTSTVSATIQLPGRWALLILDIDPQGKFVYVLNLLVAPKVSDQTFATLKVDVSDIAPSVVYKIDTASQQVVGSLQVDRFACDIAISPDGKFLYIPNQLDKLVTVVDLSTFTVIESISGQVQGEQQGGSMITLSPTGKWLFLEDAPSHNWPVPVDIEGPNNEIIVDPATRKIVKTIPLDETPGIDEFSPNGKYTTVTLKTKVVIIDTDTLEVVGLVPVEGPGTPTYSPDSRYAYVPSGHDANVVVIDLKTFQIAKKVTLPFSPGTIIPYDLRGLLGYKLIPVSQTS